MVFRKEKGNDGFHRQFSALRHQLGGHGDEEGDEQDEPNPEPVAENAGEQMEPAVESPYREREPAPYRSSSGESSYSVPESPAPAVYENPAPPAFDLSGLPSGKDASVIAHDAIWDGDLRTNGSLHVHGTVSGTLEATDSVYIAEEANVDGTVTAKNVVVGGLVKGTIQCSARFEALATGRLLADIHAPSVVIHEGAVMRGGFQMDKSSAADEKPMQATRRAARHR